MTLLEMYNARNTDTELLDRIQSALSVHAKNLINNPAATDAQKSWSVFTLSDPLEKAKHMMWEYVTDASYPFTDNDTGVQFIVDVHGELY